MGGGGDNQGHHGAGNRPELAGPGTPEFCFPLAKGIGTPSGPIRDICRIYFELGPS
jgi:hypothetical protein